MGVHESQSLLWERMVGLGRPFAAYLLPKIKAAFPQVSLVSSRGLLAGLSAHWINHHLRRPCLAENRVWACVMVIIHSQLPLSVTLDPLCSCRKTGLQRTCTAP